ncbi:SAM-dependent methyltransferase [Halothiobacillus diazotrophicus]|uniref:SAM-dependent methyltransferase n=1 Tax=Halothiobacillus diazotrophicus TaxID=1860122 RepID=A0A191ZEU0_9GAMM|nr:5-histidylcysteine sulfoxide synthase [Halothiobacillus diazotrophicus]ANJ66388.1 SAM-dependent methyltransferase [Halothiobacillus diazotrophicus]
MPMPALSGSDPEAKRAEIRTYYHQTSDLFERLFDLLATDEAFYLRPESLRHPHIFYFGHTAVFFVNKLVLAKLLPERIDSKLESIFAVGVDEMSWDDLNDAHYDWPTVEATRAYRRKVRAAVDTLIQSLPLQLPITWESPFWPILMGIEHERIHLETSSVLIRQTPLHYLDAEQRHHWPIYPESGSAPINALLPVPGGPVNLGKRDDFYGWDNEYGRHEVIIPDFTASRYLVSNGEYLAFVDDRGYETDSWWDEEGLAWRNYRRAMHPVFWIADNNQPHGFRYRALAEEIPLPLDWPVDVNQLEAAAFCRWLSAKSGMPVRLPYEDEWYRLADVAAVPDHDQWPLSASEGLPGANIALAHFASACPVDRFAHGPFHDVVGNVWQWTGTPIYPFDGFKVHPLYDDFTTPTYDGRHNLIKGGSFISTGDEAQLSARYAFRRHFFQHAGFRYVQSDYSEHLPTGVYETDSLVSQYAEFGWGDRYFGIENYPAVCARKCIEAMGDRPRGRALDVGCATGRSTFELATAFETVTGLDFSARFIRVAEQMRGEGRIRYVVPTEGALVDFREVPIPEALAAYADRIGFWQADACNLKPQFTGYDLIFAGNLIDRLYDPAKFLREAVARLNPGGLLVLSSPYTWLEEHTPKGQWLGGYKEDGEPVTTMAGLTACLTPTLRLVSREDVPFVIRETARKFQHSIAELSIWEKTP